MVKLITQYRVFIGSPGCLDDERQCFRRVLEKYTRIHSQPRDVAFQPVGWEDTIGGVGRPQALINEDIKQCDYAVFVLHDRWGSPTGSHYTSGFAEEWALAEELYTANKVRNIALFFKNVERRQLDDPGEQLRAVLAFKDKIEAGKRYLFRQYDAIENFSEALEVLLAQWLRDHEKPKTGMSSDLLIGSASAMVTASSSSAPGAPDFDFWITEAIKQGLAGIPDQNAALFCATKAIAAATSDIESARAQATAGVALFHLGKLDEAISAFTTVAERFPPSIDADLRYWQAQALFNKGVSLGALGRGIEEIAVYDDLLARFGTATELPLREAVAVAELHKRNLLKS